jgi:hypothetical protein
MSKFELLKHESTSDIVEHTYFIQDDKGKIIYKEWVDIGGKMIDFELRDHHGCDLDDAALLEQIWEFVDSLNQ